jgi:hypothetical protein
MANAWYSKGLEGFATGAVNWTGDAIHVDLLDLADYTVSITTHDFRDDVPVAARVATFGPLTGKTATDGVLDAADATFTTVTGDQSEALTVWKNTGSDATSRLLLFFDTATGLPVTPNGGNIAVTWDNGANRIARL